MLNNIVFETQVSGADRIAGAQKYMGRSSFTYDDYAVIAAVILIIIGFAILVASAYAKQKAKHKNGEY